MIYLLCSTIRPEVFKECHKEWVKNADNIDNVITKLVVDTDKDKEALEGYDVVVYRGVSKGITKPLTFLTQSLTGLNDDDIIVVMSDDFFPPEHWDTFLIDQYKDFTGGLSVFDGGPPEVQQTIITIPILDYATLKKLNKIVYHPAYTHMYSDNELYHNLLEMNLLKVIDPALGYTFEHRHWTRGERTYDEQDKVLNRISLNYDSKIFQERKDMPLEERLKYEPKTLLSILVCTIEGREDLLQHLMDRLDPQLVDEVEVLVECDNCEMTIGAKRNKLLDRAKGEYVVFVDDDDLVSNYYVELVLGAIASKPDCVGIKGIITTDGKNPKLFVHSLRFNEWGEENGVYVRTPNHCNPIRREIALDVKFDPERSFGEDKDYSDRLRGKLKSEQFILPPIYEYLYRTVEKEYFKNG